MDKLEIVKQYCGLAHIPEYIWQGKKKIPTTKATLRDIERASTLAYCKLMEAYRTYDAYLSGSIRESLSKIIDDSTADYASAKAAAYIRKRTKALEMDQHSLGVLERTSYKLKLSDRQRVIPAIAAAAQASVSSD